MIKNTLVLVLVILVLVLTGLILKKQTESFKNRYVKINSPQIGVLQHSKYKNSYPHVSLFGWVSSDTLKDKKLKHLFNQQYKKTKCCEVPLISEMPKYRYYLPKNNNLMVSPISAEDNNRKGVAVNISGRL